MKLQIVLLAGLLAGCQTIPSDIVDIKRNVDSRITYKHYYKHDYRYLPQGGEGNCAVFAYNYAVDAMRKGYKARVVVANDAHGEPHATALVDERYVLDNQLKHVATK